MLRKRYKVSFVCAKYLLTELQLLWKHVERSPSSQTSSVDDWCKLCLHPLFEKAGAQNKAKISRLACPGSEKGIQADA